MKSSFRLEVHFLPPEMGGLLLESISEGFQKLMGTKWDQAKGYFYYMTLS